MRGVAPGGLLDLRTDCQPMPDKGRSRCYAMVGGSPKPIEVERRGDAGHQHHCAIQRSWIAEGGERAEHALAADHRGMDVVSARKPYAKRDRAPVGQIS